MLELLAEELELSAKKLRESFFVGLHSVARYLARP